MKIKYNIRINYSADYHYKKINLKIMSRKKVIALDK